MALKRMAPAFVHSYRFLSKNGVQAALSLEKVSSGLKNMEDHMQEDNDDERDSDGDETRGYAALIQQHRRQFPPRNNLQAEVDSTMKRFEQQEAMEEAERTALLARPVDDDGFTTVTYKKKRRRDKSSSHDIEDTGQDDTNVRKKKRKGASQLPDFYRFQMRESRREELVNLRSKFEQDKARVAKMKEQRKFKPF